MSSIQLQLEFSGGLELLFNNQKTHQITLPTPSSANTADAQNKPDMVTMADLLEYIRSNMIKERPDLFMQNNTVRPGILVLINDVDWELKGQLTYTLSNNDTIVFISTLHGG